MAEINRMVAQKVGADSMVTAAAQSLHGARFACPLARGFNGRNTIHQVLKVHYHGHAFFSR